MPDAPVAYSRRHREHAVLVALRTAGLRAADAPSTSRPHMRCIAAFARISTSRSLPVVTAMTLFLATAAASPLGAQAGGASASICSPGQRLEVVDYGKWHPA